MRFVLLLVALFAAGCSYLKTAGKQAYFAARQPLAPRQRVYKHMLSRETYFVYGQLLANPPSANMPIAVVALSDTFEPSEVVDVNLTTRSHSYFGLNLPGGNYHLVAVADTNNDGHFDENEIFASTDVALSVETAPDLVLGGCDLSQVFKSTAGHAFRIAATHSPSRQESLFFPKGTLRVLEDPIFSPEMATLGLYEPAAFLEKAPMMFYALEEDIGYRVPVIFVHGIGGSAREFSDLVAGLDRKHYQPWFFYYPSGGDLQQLSSMFYRIFLSGKVIPREDMPVVIVAHSMGGLVVREALNHCSGAKTETKVGRVITLASPLGGHPAARNAVHAPVVIPSWHDLSPESNFIKDLHRNPLPKGTAYSLFYASGKANADSPGSNASDGVVPITSQQAPLSVAEATEYAGFASTHTGILHDPKAVTKILSAIETVKAPYPEDQMAYFLQGGFTLTNPEDYTAMEAYCLTKMGHYMEALIAGKVIPTHPLQKHFVAAAKGECEPTQPAETAWLKYQRKLVVEKNQGHRE